MKRSARGFTLIELLIVIAIVAILSSILLAAFATARAKSRDSARKATAHQIMNALELYITDNGSYPLAASVTDLSTALNPALVPQYMKSINYDMTNISGPTYYRPASPGASYLLYVSLEIPSAPNIYGCRMGIGPVVDQLYPGTPRC